MEAIVIAPLQPRDLEAIVAIEETIASPWSAEQWRREFELPYSWGFAARRAGQAAVAGYILGWTIADEAEIHKVAVAAAARRLGVGSALLAHALRLLHQQGIRRCFLELRATNLAARRLYANHGFQETGRRKKYYSEPDEDAVIMARTV